MNNLSENIGKKVRTGPWVAFIIILFVIIAFLFASNFNLKTQLVSAGGVTLEDASKKTRIVSFTSLFIDLVLMSNEEISFNNRLELENRVREIDDQEIFEKWQEFTSTEDPESAQRAVVEFLGILIDKLK